MKGSVWDQKRVDIIIFGAGFGSHYTSRTHHSTSDLLIPSGTPIMVWYNSLPDALRRGENFTPSALFAQYAVLPLRRNPLLTR